MPHAAAHWKPIFSHEIPDTWRAAHLRNNALPPDAEELFLARRDLGLMKGEAIHFNIAVALPDSQTFRDWMDWNRSQQGYDLTAIITMAQDIWLHRWENLRATRGSLISTGRQTPIGLGVRGGAVPP